MPGWFTSLWKVIKTNEQRDPQNNSVDRPLLQVDEGAASTSTSTSSNYGATDSSLSSSTTMSFSDEEKTSVQKQFYSEQLEIVNAIFWEWEKKKGRKKETVTPLQKSCLGSIQQTTLSLIKCIQENEDTDGVNVWLRPGAISEASKIISSVCRNWEQAYESYPEKTKREVFFSLYYVVSSFTEKATFIRAPLFRDHILAKFISEQPFFNVVAKHFYRVNTIRFDEIEIASQLAEKLRCFTFFNSTPAGLLDYGGVFTKKQSRECLLTGGRNIRNALKIAQHLVLDMYELLSQHSRKTDDRLGEALYHLLFNTWKDIQRVLKPEIESVFHQTSACRGKYEDAKRLCDVVFRTSLLTLRELGFTAVMQKASRGNAVGICAIHAHCVKSAIDLQREAPFDVKKESVQGVLSKAAK